MSVLNTESKHSFTPVEMMHNAEQFALSKSKKSTGMILSLAIMAGVFIGLAFLFYITVTTGSESGWGVNRLLGGLAFSMGLILIVICGGELFTSSILSTISWANKQISCKQMLKIWGKVYLGNFIGASFLVALVFAAQMYQLDNSQWGLNALNIAQHKLHHSPMQAIALGILCNLLVCLAIWLTFSTNNAMTKAFMVILPVSMFVSSGFEHCVANMFMVPLGIMIQNFAPDSFWLNAQTTAAQYADLNIGQFIFSNLIPVTFGNIIGGAVLVGLFNWTIYTRPQLKLALKPITHTQKLTSVKEFKMNTHIFAKNIMNTKPTALTADMPIGLAMDVLALKNSTSAPVCDINGKLVGFLSAHDVMVELWCQDYLPNNDKKVVDLMSRNVIAIDINERLVDIVEYFSIDKDQVYPTTSMGIATSMAMLSVEERAKAAVVKKPQVLPVLDNGQFVGLITRTEVMNALRPVFGERMNVVQQKTELKESA